MSIDSYVAAWDATLAPGQSERSRCPKCAATEASFVVTKLDDGSLAWICHRASCGYRGRRTSAATSEDYQPCARRPEDAFVPEVNLDPSSLVNGMMYDTLSGGYYAPIYHWRHGQIGFQLRWYDGRKPKVRSYRTAQVECEFMHWTFYPSDKAIIVEDWLSARRASAATHYASVALLGTTFNAKRAAELKRFQVEDLIFALDPDAYTLALKYVREWKPFFRLVRAVRLPADPKDMKPEELRNYLGTQDIVSAVPPSKL